MDGNRQAIIREVAVIVVIIALILTAGGFLVRNVVTGFLSLGGEMTTSETAGEPLFGDLEKKLQEFTGRFFQEKKPAPEPSKPQDKPAPQQAEPPKPSAQAANYAEIKQVRFFETGKDIPAPKDRSYRTQFSPQARYIYTEVNYRNKNHKVRDAEFTMLFQYFNEQGQQLANINSKARPKKEWESAMYTAGWGGAPGTWKPGAYTVKVFIEGDFIGDYKFLVE